MIPKAKKPNHVSSSYQPISFLRVASKIFEKLLRRLILAFEYHHLNSASERIIQHSARATTSSSLLPPCEERICHRSFSGWSTRTCVRLSLAVGTSNSGTWKSGTCGETLENFTTYSLIFQGIFKEKMFLSFTSDSFPILAGHKEVSEVLFSAPSFYIVDIPHHTHTIPASFADDKTILSTNANDRMGFSFKKHLSLIEIRTNNRKIQLNEEKHGVNT